MKSVKLAALAAALCLGGIATQAMAQSTATETFTAGAYVGYNTGSPGCPAAHWQIVPVGDHLTGYVFNTDGSGISQAMGTAQKDGSFTLNLTNVSGKGPTGTITGHRMPGGGLSAMLAGSSCSFATPMMPLMAPPNVNG